METMSLTASTDAEIMAWLGQRLVAIREQQRLTGQDAAARAGLSRRTVYRAERGLNPNLLTIVRLLRVYGRLDALSQFLPEPEVSPMALLRERQRATKRRGGA
jgi:transcriptional regulator with XRE-family HTH domain